MTVCLQNQPGKDARKQREKEPRVLSRRMQISGLLMLAILVAGCGAARPVKYYVLDVNPAPTNSASAQVPVTLLVGEWWPRICITTTGWCTGLVRCSWGHMSTTAGR